MSVRKLEQVAPFHFCVDIGDYTGISAASYEDFLTSIKEVKGKSLGFHVKRGDFERWVLDILKDEKLAKEIGKIKKQKLSSELTHHNLIKLYQTEGLRESRVWKS